MQASNILCPTDFDAASGAAFAEALALAAESGGRVTLLHVYPLPTTVYSPGFPRFADVSLVGLIEAAAREQLAPLAAQARDRGVHLEGVTVLGHPVETITALARRERHDLIVVSAVARGWFTRLLFGSPYEQIARRAPCPVLFVPAHFTTSTSSSPSRFSTVTPTS